MGQLRTRTIPAKAATAQKATTIKNWIKITRFSFAMVTDRECQPDVIKIDHVFRCLTTLAPSKRESKREGSSIDVVDLM